jgi:transcriptional regulator with XRE-family HTH domain
MAGPHQNRPAGDLLRDWRQRRRLSQLALALEAGISQRHLSFVESGRATPSREMVLNLAETLDMPLRLRNTLLMAAGHAPAFGNESAGEPSEVMTAVRLVLKGHEPFPAIAVDRHWTLIEANAAAQPFLAAVRDPALLQPPVNVLRVSLHPQGLAPLIENLAEWRVHLLARVRRQMEISGDAELVRLHDELAALAGGREPPPRHQGPLPIALPFRLRFGDRVLNFLSTITVFGSPLDVMLDEIAIESFFPADAATAAALGAPTRA